VLAVADQPFSEMAMFVLVRRDGQAAATTSHPAVMVTDAG
jgi:hypothetical protein